MFRLAASGTERRTPQDVTLLLWQVVLGVWLGLIACSLAQDLGLFAPASSVTLLDVEHERSIYTWFSQLILAVAALELYRVARISSKRSMAFALQWFGLAALFLCLSADEALSFHERLSVPTRSLLNTDGFLWLAWVIPVGGICGVGLIAAVPLLRSLPSSTRRRILLSACLFLSGALGLEMVEAQLLVLADHRTSLPYDLAVNLEEALEGGGVLLFLSALVSYRRALITDQLGM